MKVLEQSKYENHYKVKKWSISKWQFEKYVIYINDNKKFCWK